MNIGFMTIEKGISGVERGTVRSVLKEFDHEVSLRTSFPWGQRESEDTGKKYI